MPRKKSDAGRGFTCPDCCIRLDVIHTQATPTGIVRVRLCPVCFHMERTEERSQGAIMARPKTPGAMGTTGR